MCRHWAVFTFFVTHYVFSIRIDLPQYTLSNIHATLVSANVGMTKQTYSPWVSLSGQPLLFEKHFVHCSPTFPLIAVSSKR